MFEHVGEAAFRFYNRLELIHYSPGVLTARIHEFNATEIHQVVGITRLNSCVFSLTTVSFMTSLSSLKK